MRRLRAAGPSEVARCLLLIDALAVAVTEVAEDEGRDCGKCEAKLWLFAARIAEHPYPHLSHRYTFSAKKLAPPRPMLWSFADLREEIDWYIQGVAAQVGSTRNA